VHYSPAWETQMAQLNASDTIQTTHSLHNQSDTLYTVFVAQCSSMQPSCAVSNDSPATQQLSMHLEHTVTVTASLPAVLCCLCITLPQIRCLNEDVEGNCKNVFKSWSKRTEPTEHPLKSDPDDAELLLHIPYATALHNHSYTRTAGVLGVGCYGCRHAAAQPHPTGCSITHGVPFTGPSMNLPNYEFAHP
jgi:hypothetical protein